MRSVLATQAPVCHVTEFGENAVQLMLRFWIEDPANGVVNVKGEVYLRCGIRSASTASSCPTRSAIFTFATCPCRRRAYRPAEPRAAVEMGD